MALGVTGRAGGVLSEVSEVAAARSFARAALASRGFSGSAWVGTTRGARTRSGQPGVRVGGRKRNKRERDNKGDAGAARGAGVKGAEGGGGKSGGGGKDVGDTSILDAEVVSETVTATGGAVPSPLLRAPAPKSALKPGLAGSLADTDKLRVRALLRGDSQP